MNNYPILNNPNARFGGRKNFRKLSGIQILCGDCLRWRQSNATVVYGNHASLRDIRDSVNPRRDFDQLETFTSYRVCDKGLTRYFWYSNHYACPTFDSRTWELYETSYGNNTIKHNVDNYLILKYIAGYMWGMFYVLDVNCVVNTRYWQKCCYESTTAPMVASWNNTYNIYICICVYIYISFDSYHNSLSYLYVDFVLLYSSIMLHRTVNWQVSAIQIIRCSVGRHTCKAF